MLFLGNYTELQIQSYLQENVFAKLVIFGAYEVR